MSSHLSVRKSLSGAHLFLTGVTGFLGKVFLVKLLDEVPDVRRVTLLVRAGKGASAQERFERIVNRSPAMRPLRAKYGEGLYAMLREKLEIVEGDASDPRCGLDEQTIARLADSVDLVVHVAGVTDFDPVPRDAISSNVMGALNAADVAASTKRARLLHISTCFQCGNDPGRVPEEIADGKNPNGESIDLDRILEDLVAFADEAASSHDGGKAQKKARRKAGVEFAEKHGWPNLYTLTKSVAEQKLARRSDISLAVIRPAIVECALSYPMTGWNEGINTSGPLVWLLSTPFNELPARADNHFDVVPVDLVVNAMLLIAAAHLDNRAGGVYQVGSSDDNPLTIGRAIELTSLGARRHHERADASSLERLVFKYFDTVPVTADRDSLFSVKRLTRMTRAVSDAVQKTDLKKLLPESAYEMFGETLTRKQWEVHMKLSKAGITLRSVERMLELYKPFTHDNDWVYESARMRDLASSLAAEEQGAFGYDVKSYDWRNYWLEVQWPGLAKWCLPLLEGKDAPEDAPPATPFSMTATSDSATESRVSP